MKKTNRSESVDSYVDPVEYMFIGWLIRRELFATFKANYERFNPGERPFRLALRSVLRCKLSSGKPRLGSLVTGFFPFGETLEGFDFWMNQAFAWLDFCKKFQTKF